MCGERERERERERVCGRGASNRSTRARFGRRHYSVIVAPRVLSLSLSLFLYLRLSLSGIPAVSRSLTLGLHTACVRACGTEGESEKNVLILRRLLGSYRLARAHAPRSMSRLIAKSPYDSRLYSELTMREEEGSKNKLDGIRLEWVRERPDNVVV